jgi:thiamine pyrophosphokinase
MAFCMPEESKTAVVILANGQLDDIPAIRRRLATLNNPIVLAADGGSRHAQALGLRVQAVIGDMDSLDAQELAALRTAGADVRQAPRHKDESDLELALLYAAEMPVPRLVVLAAFGGRMDATLANVQLLLDPRLAGRRVELWQSRQTAWLIRPPGEDLPGQPGDTLSLIPLGGPAKDIVTYGLQYPLDHEDLPAGPARGLSNMLQGENPRVNLASGALLAIHTPGRA